MCTVSIHYFIIQVQIMLQYVDMCTKINAKLTACLTDGHDSQLTFLEILQKCLFVTNRGGSKGGGARPPAALPVRGLAHCLSKIKFLIFIGRQKSIVWHLKSADKISSDKISHFILDKLCRLINRKCCAVIGWRWFMPRRRDGRTVISVQVTALISPKLFACILASDHDCRSNISGTSVHWLNVCSFFLNPWYLGMDLGLGLREDPTYTGQFLGKLAHSPAIRLIIPLN